MENRIKIKVDNKAFTLVGEETEEHMQKVATYVDETMFDIRQNTSAVKMDSSLAYVLTSVTVADKLLKESEKNEDLEKKVRVFSEQLEKYKTDFESIKEEYDNFMAEFRDTKLQLENAKFNLENAQTDLDRAKIDLENANYDLENANIECDNAKIEVNNIKYKLDNTKLELQNARADIATVEGKFKKSKLDTEEMKRDFEQQLEYEKSEFELLDEDNIQTVKDNILLKKNYKKLKLELDEKLNIEDVLTKQLEFEKQNVEFEKQNVSAERKKAKKEKFKHDEEKVKYEQDKMKSEEFNSKQKENVDNLEEEIKNQKSTIEMLESTIETLKTTVGLEEEKNELLKQINNDITMKLSEAKKSNVSNSLIEKPEIIDNEKKSNEKFIVKEESIKEVKKEEIKEEVKEEVTEEPIKEIVEESIEEILTEEDLDEVYINESSEEHKKIIINGQVKVFEEAEQIEITKEIEIKPNKPIVVVPEKQHIETNEQVGKKDDESESINVENSEQSVDVNANIKSYTEEQVKEIVDKIIVNEPKKPVVVENFNQSEDNTKHRVIEYTSPIVVTNDVIKQNNSIMEEVVVNEEAMHDIFENLKVAVDEKKSKDFKNYDNYGFDDEYLDKYSDKKNNKSSRFNRRKKKK